MKTELEKYLELIGKLNKNANLFLDVEDEKGTESKKRISFYEIAHLNKPIQDKCIYFSFVLDKIDDNYIADLEQGLLNLLEQGYNIRYSNPAKKDGKA